jgi:hypothetical protein|tara:strand:- start:54 stop:200 length:147 start_codon:yes stop_codon:yes gene_type:complete
MDDFNLNHELQKLAAESDQIEVTIDEDGEVEFELDIDLFLEIIRKTWI